MEDYKFLAEKILEGKKESMPSHNGSVSQYQKRYESFMKVLQESDTALKGLGNKFITERNCDMDEIETIRQINKELIQSIISYFNSNR